MSSDIDPKTLSYEAEVAPRWAEPFARLLLSVAPIDPKAMVLDVLCGTGSTSVPLLDKLEQRGRVVALDPSSARLAVARRKAGALVGKRLFFRHEKLERFSFTNDVFDVVLSNAGVLEGGDPMVLQECLRVAKPGGLLAMTLPLRGTFRELFDLLREVLERRDETPALRRLDEHLRTYPSEDEALVRFERLGLEDVKLSSASFPVEFPSGRALLGSELVVQLFAEKWVALVGEQATAVFQELAQTVDTYLGAEPFEVTVEAACLLGKKRAGLTSEKPESAFAGAAGSSLNVIANEPLPQRPIDPAIAQRADEAEEVTPVRDVAIPPEASVAEVEPSASQSVSSPSGTPSDMIFAHAEIRGAEGDARAPAATEGVARKDEVPPPPVARKGPPPLPPPLGASEGTGVGEPTGAGSAPGRPRKKKR